MGGRAVAVCVALCSLAAATVAGPTRATVGCPWLAKSLAPSQRTALLMSAMTVQDKLALVSGIDVSAPQWAPLAGGYVGYVPANTRLCIPPLTLNDGGAGVADGQLGTTTFPAPIAQTATWDPLAQRALGKAIGREAWQKGIDVLLAPDVNIARVPENGRNFEAFGEDPFLSSQAAVAEIEGIQQNPVVATVKHFAVNSSETNRWYLSSNVDDRTLHEIYLPPFEASVELAHAGSVMCAYGLVNARFDCQDKGLLTTMLRTDWGFDGFVVSDWHATQSAGPAAAAGLDLEMPTGEHFGAPLVHAVAAGTVRIATLDRMARSILTSMFRLGLFDDPPLPYAKVRLAQVSTPAHQILARHVLEEGAVLLKNDGPILPLQPARSSTIAVIGKPAGDPNLAPYLAGGGSSYIAATNAVSPLQGLTARAAAAGATVAYADGADPDAAAAVAAESSVAIVFAYDHEAEGEDRPDLTLPNAQDTLIADVVRANPHTVVVLETGGPVLMPWSGVVPAVLEAWYPGQQAGTAIAALLFGDVAPSGRLPQTFPASAGQGPITTQTQWPGSNDAQDAAFSEGLFVGYRWYDHSGQVPLFPFGFGLTYTRFAYSTLRLHRIAAGGIDVTFTLTNTGARAGVDVPQVYVDDPAAAQEPPRQLFGFRRVFLRPGQKAEVRIRLGWRAFAQWSPRLQDWAVTPGLYRVLVGRSSRDLPLRASYRPPR